MTNQTTASLPPPAFALKAAARSEAQIERLKSERQNVLRAFAYHPFVAVVPLRGDPPTQYRVDFRVRSIVVDADEQLQYVDAVPIEIWLPPGFPNEAPLARPLAAVFHPNISSDAVCFSGGRKANESLVDLIGRIGEYLAWRGYDPQAVVNDLAVQWMGDNGSLLPLDPQADFSPQAGGEPLERIGRFGAATLGQMGSSMDEVIAALSGESAGPTIEQVRAFSRQTRAAMRLFLAEDIPPELRLEASEFDQSALDLPASVPLWQHIQRQNAWTKPLVARSGELTEAAARLKPEMQKLAALVPGEFADAAEAARQMPPATALQSFLLQLPAIYQQAASSAEALRALLTQPGAQRPTNPLSGEGFIARQLAARLDDADQKADAARKSATDTLAALEPMLLGFRAEILALRVIGMWREYIDTFEKAAALEQRIACLSGDAFEAYMIKSGESEFGPFQIEQELALGDVVVAVINKKPGAIEVRKVDDEKILGAGTSGSAVAMVPAEGQSPTPMTFTLTDRCDELLLQLQYAFDQARAILPKLQSAAGGGDESWCGRMMALFAAPQAQQGALAQQRRALDRWESLIADLTALSAYKARLATCFMLRRAESLVSRLMEERAKHGAALKHANARVAAIAAKSGHDATGQLIIPPKWAREYAEQNEAIEPTEAGIRRIDARLAKVSNRLKQRLAMAHLCGRPEIPELHVIGAISDDLVAAAGDISDDFLTETAARLAADLKATFEVKMPPAPEPKAAPPAPVAAAAVPEEAAQTAPAEPVAEIAGHEPAAEAAAVDDVHEETQQAAQDDPFAISFDEEPVADDDVILDDRMDQGE